MIWLDAFAWLTAAVVSVPLLVLAAECLLACLGPRPRQSTPPAARPGCAVLIPAHDEEAGLGRTLAALAPELGPGDRVLVVADNCTDRTADVAREHGIGVVERSDPARRGKGYALAFGLDALRPDPPAVVVVLDADCVIGSGSLARLVARAAATGRPVQAAYRMAAPAAAGTERKVAEFAFLVKNVVRPLGLSRLGLPCLLTGTGMAFPWDLISAAQLGHGHIVEDMQLAVELAAAGRPAVFAPDAEVSAEFPVGARAAGAQRRRWEHGHLKVLLAGVPKLLAATARRGRVGPLALALELGVPPLSALVCGTALVLIGLAAWALFGRVPGPAVLLTSAAGCAMLGILTAWSRYGRNALPPTALLRVPLYVLRKVPVYLGFVTSTQVTWVRTERSPTEGPTSAGSTGA